MKRRDEVLVGIFVTVAVAILIIGTIWLTRGGLSRGYPVYTHFAWGAGLKQGQPVLLAGQSIGYVDAIELNLKEGYVDVDLRIQKKVRIPAGSKATIKPVGIFGDVAVALTPPFPIPQTYYKSGDSIPPGAETPDIGDILKRVDSIGGSLQRLATSIDKDLIAPGGLKDLRKTLALTTEFAGQLQALAAKQNENLTMTLGEFRLSAKRLSTLADSAVIDSTLKNFRATAGNLNRLALQADSTVRAMRPIIDGLQAGTGPAGMFLKDPTLARNIISMTAHLDSLIVHMDSLQADFKKNPKKYIKLSIF